MAEDRDADRLGSRDLGANRRSRAVEDRRFEAPEVSDDDRLNMFREQLFNDALPDLPDIPGWHVCWLTTTNPSDSIQKRTRLGYQPVLPEEVPGFEFSTATTGEYAGMVAVNEMVAFKLPMSLYLKFMQEAHHDAPDREEDKLAEVAEIMRRGAEEAGSRLAEGDGMVEMRESKPRRGVFYS